MTEIEKLFDRIGQCLFRMETNFEVYSRCVRVSLCSDTNEAAAAAAKSAILADLEALKDVKREMEHGDKQLVAITESERQMTLLALAHLSVRRPGWGQAIAELAFKMDMPDHEGRPTLYEQFKETHVYVLPDEPSDATLSQSLGLDK